MISLGIADFPRAKAQGSDSFAAKFGQHVLNQRFGEGDIPLEFLGIGPTRNTSIAFPAFSRAVTLVSGVCAGLISGGMLQIIDEEENVVDTRRTRNILQVLRRTPDKRSNISGHMFIEDCFSDYMIDGNVLIVPTVGDMYGELLGFRRFRPWDAYMLRGEDMGDRAYHMLEADVTSAHAEMIGESMVIHARWPKLMRFGLSANSREGFATPPVIQLRVTLGTALCSDKYMYDWFRSGPKTRSHVNYEIDPDKLDATPEQKDEARKAVGEVMQGRYGPLVTYGAKSLTIEDSPADRFSKEHHDFLVEEIGRFYGIPLPLMSVSIRSWGAAVNEQIAKMAYRWGIKLHIDRFLSSMALILLRPNEMFRVDPAELVRGDAEGLKEYIMALQGDMQRPPIATMPELRHIAGLPKKPQGEFGKLPTPDGTMPGSKEPNK